MLPSSLKRESGEQMEIQIIYIYIIISAAQGHCHLGEYAQIALSSRSLSLFLSVVIVAQGRDPMPEAIQAR